MNAIENHSSTIESANVHMLPMEYIKNPILHTMMRGNLTLPLTKIMESIIYQLQDRINEHIIAKKMGELVTINEMDNNGMLHFEIPLKSLGIPAQNYKELEDACDAILHMEMSVVQPDDTTRRVNVFHAIEVPFKKTTGSGGEVLYKGGKRRDGIVKIEMPYDSARMILSLRKGYTEHLFGIPSLCRCPRTPRFYTYLSNAYNKGLDYTIFKYDELKDWCGVNRREGSSKDTDAYKKYAEFKRSVLDPAQKELKKLSDEGKVDFHFDFEPMRPEGITRGNPTAIKFIIKRNRRGSMSAQERFLNGIYSKLIKEFNITSDEWSMLTELLKDLRQDAVNSAIKSITAKTRKANPDIPHAYFTSLLYEWASVQEKVEIVNVTEMDELPTIDPALWKGLTILGIEADKTWWETFGECCSISKIEDGCVTLSMPSVFVKEKWEEQFNSRGWLYIAVSNVFKDVATKINYIVEHE